MSNAASLPHIGLNLQPHYSLTAEYGTYALSGQDAALSGSSYALAADYGTYALSGQDAGLSEGGTDTPAPFPHLGLLGGLGFLGYTLTVEQGEYLLTGQDAAFVATYNLTAASGSYSLSGKAAALVESFGRVGDPGPFPHIGLLLGFQGNRTLVADAGIYALVGSEGLGDYESTLETSTYALTGQDAGLLFARILTAEYATYTLSGQDADLPISGVDRSMAADYGTYSLTGQDAATLAQYPLTAEQGFYALHGQAADFIAGEIVHSTITAEYGSYTLSGQDAALTRGPAILQADTGYYTLQGFDVPSRGGVVPAGRSKRRRKKTEVEIDGEVFTVETKEDATRLLEEARAEAERVAALVIDRASKAERRPARKVLADARKALQVPVIDADEELQSDVEKLTQEIAEMFNQALQTVEIAALMRKAEIEEDDEDVLLLLS
jgi:hypothetical protein